MMRAALTSSIVVLAATPAAAVAARPQPLQDLPPQTTRFDDRVLDRRVGPVATAAQSRSASFPTREGYSVRVSFSAAYGFDREVGASYVAFLDALPHGRELADLDVYIATPSEVIKLCDGVAGTVACYGATNERMIVPGEEVGSSQGVSTSYVLTHEYGHHIAANRDNKPFNALAIGPRYWASYERICDRSLDGELAPGDEARRYRFNPGESWAEVYARLRYPHQPWVFAPALRPDADAIAAALRDVLDPWDGYRTRTFRGTFGGARTKDYSFPLNLDGRLVTRVDGQAGNSLRLTVLGQGRRRLGSSSSRGPDHTLRFSVACREERRETVTLAVTRVRGSGGSFTVSATYAG